MNTPLTGDARRRRRLDEMRFRREREALQSELRGINYGLQGARKIRNRLERQLQTNWLMQRFVAVRADWITALAREQSAKRDLGEL